MPRRQRQMRQPHPQPTILRRTHRIMGRRTHRIEPHHRHTTMARTHQTRHPQARPIPLPDPLRRHLHRHRDRRRQDHPRRTATRPRNRPAQLQGSLPTMQRPQGTHRRPRPARAAAHVSKTAPRVGGLGGPYPQGRAPCSSATFAACMHKLQGFGPVQRPVWHG